jgi:hypothetical protein
VLHATFLMTLCSTTPNPVSRTAHSAYSRALAAPAAAAARTIASTESLSYRANERAAHSARCSMARARGTPAGSVSSSFTSMAAPVTVSPQMFAPLTGAPLW